MSVTKDPLAIHIGLSYPTSSHQNYNCQPGVLVLSMHVTRLVAAMCNVRETRAEQHDNTKRDLQ